ncbi:MAG TPA: low molecular weight protein-tyrosine-phosphatase [Polyangiaceae bacterium]|nr:low molecular weight protein-tyrosine-phosphatase [Polyangiaceae bacterium]
MTDDERSTTARLSVCFVCLGNICRSPTAEGVFLRQLAASPWQGRVDVDSAGTASYHVGSRADARSRAHAERRGYRLESRARQFEAGDLERFDYVLCMDEANLRDVRALGTAGRARVGLFREFDASAPAGSSVPDPYYGGDAGFEEVLDQCERAAAGLLRELGQRLDQRS